MPIVALVVVVGSAVAIDEVVAGSGVGAGGAIVVGVCSMAAARAVRVGGVTGAAVAGVTAAAGVAAAVVGVTRRHSIRTLSSCTIGGSCSPATPYFDVGNFGDVGGVGGRLPVLKDGVGGRYRPDIAGGIGDRACRASEHDGVVGRRGRGWRRSGGRRWCGGWRRSGGWDRQGISAGTPDFKAKVAMAALREGARRTYTTPENKEVDRIETKSAEGRGFLPTIKLAAACGLFLCRPHLPNGICRHLIDPDQASPLPGWTAAFMQRRQAPVMWDRCRRGFACKPGTECAAVDFAADLEQQISAIP